MSDNLFTVIDFKLDPQPRKPSAEVVASVEAHLAMWAAANSQPRVYFEKVDYRTYKVAYGDDVSYYPLATWALNAIETAAQS